MSSGQAFINTFLIINLNQWLVDNRPKGLLARLIGRKKSMSERKAKLSDAVTFYQKETAAKFNKVQQLKEDR